MSRYFFAVISLIATLPLSAQVPAFQYRAGDEYRIRVEQVTRIEDTTLDEQTKKPTTAKMQSRLTVVKAWKVRALEKENAVLELSVAAMRLERTDAKGEVSVYDSEKPDEKEPANDAEFRKFIGRPLAAITVDPRGRVVAVRECLPASQKGFEIELPFKVLLPDKAFGAGSTWNRDFEIELPPPAGTGEKYKAVQKQEWAADVKGMKRIHTATAIADFPIGADGIALLKYLAEGDVFFHAESGRYIGCRLTGKKTIENYQGEGTRYVFESSLSEDLLSK